MKQWLRYLLVLSGLIFFENAPAQIIKPYQLSTAVEKTGQDTYRLIISGTLEPGWHLYSQHNDPGGSNPLVIQWKGAGQDYELLGPAKEYGTEKAYNDIFNVTETFWSHKIKITQDIKVKNPSLQQVEAHLEGQVCKEACILMGEDLSFDLSRAKNSGTTTPTTGNKPSNNTPKTSTGTSQATPKENKITPKKASPAETNTAAKQAETSGTSGANSGSVAEKTEPENTTPDMKNAGPTTETQTVNAKNTDGHQKESTEGSGVTIEEPHKKGFWGLFWASLLAGLIALLTPCIYPMIPLTISFFTKKNEQSVFGAEEKGTHGKFYAFMYGFFIILIYGLITLPFHLMDNLDPNIFNKISTNPWLNLVFFIIFFIFALSFMGVSKLDPQRLIPSKLISKSDEMSNKTGGLIAVFFMAVTLILVSFSCTGPILGALLGSVLGSSQGAWALTVGALGFGIGLSLPFTLFALFPSLLKNMPRSGGWLNTVKVTLGFIELALAFKFLSNADLVLQLHLLEREVFLSIWIAIFFALALYLLGMFKLPYDDASDRIGVTRLLFGLTSLAFTFYMLPGLWGAPLKWISAFPPYQAYSESPKGFGCHGGGSSRSMAAALPEGAEYEYDGLIVFRNNYDDALKYAKQIGRPVMLDFTGGACVNCRKMEANVWTDPEVHRIMKDSLIVVSLYVDDKRSLPENEQYISPYSNKKITTRGDKWAEMEIYKYKSNSQPYYVLLSPDEEMLNSPIAYEPDAEVYAQWLREGVKKYYGGK
ncbi:MAG: DUF255 domain-containing protein [Chlorobi bacterium]|nr:DUF255 domain-containing protein [Chlorobiota bacterium]